MSPKTLYDKIWDAHVVEEIKGGPSVLYIDRHLVHEVTSPQAFAGLDIFTAQVEHFNTSCRNNPPAPGVESVRLPGERCYAHMKMTREQGVPINEEIWTRLAATAQQYNLDLPEDHES